MIMSSCCFIWNAHRDTAAEKEFDTAIQMALGQVLVERSNKVEMDENITFNKDI